MWTEARLLHIRSVSPTTRLTAVMASSYLPPFEGAGEVKEGFLCPLCLKDLQSFYQLQDHYEEEHSGDDRHVRGQLKSKLHLFTTIVPLSLMCADFWARGQCDLLKMQFQEKNLNLI